MSIHHNDVIEYKMALLVGGIFSSIESYGREYLDFDFSPSGKKSIFINQV